MSITAFAGYGATGQTLICDHSKLQSPLACTVCTACINKIVIPLRLFALCTHTIGSLHSLHRQNLNYCGTTTTHSTQTQQAKCLQLEISYNSCEVRSSDRLSYQMSHSLAKPSLSLVPILVWGTNAASICKFGGNPRKVYFVLT